MPMSYTRERDVALNAVRTAARLCQAVQAEIDTDVLEKNDRSPVTVADFGSQALICKALHEAFPEDPVIAEEDSTALRTEENAEIREQVVARVQESHPDATADHVCDWIDHGNASEFYDRFWTLDPIDGTKGFVRGDQYAIALALIVDGTPTVAALCCPNMPDDFDTETPSTVGQVYIAVREEGVMQMPLDGSADPVPVETTSVQTADGGRFTESFVSAHSAHDMAVEVGNRLGIDEPPLRIDSQAKYAVVARGDAEIYFRLPRPGSDYIEKIWDHAAGTLVVEAAGGTVTDMHGNTLDWTKAPLLSANQGIIATNGNFHQEVLSALHDVQAELLG